MFSIAAKAMKHGCHRNMSRSLTVMASLAGCEFQRPQMTIGNIPRAMFSSNANNAPDGEAAAMESAKKFMDEVKEISHIDELATYDEWQTKVMDEKQVPIILDCYADWCAPCKKLTPVLEDLANANEGKFKLVKVNIETLPQIA